MVASDETVEDGSHGSNEGSGSQFSSDSSSALTLELNKLMDNENRAGDNIVGNWIVAPSRCLSTFRPVRQAGLPLVLCSRAIEIQNKVILDIFGGQHHRHQETITMTDITDLSDKYLAYSKGGWLLFCGRSSTGFGESLYLHNIVTGEHIDLPDIRGRQRSRVYLFSTSWSSSSVDYIVNVTRIPYAHRTTIYVTCPDTRSWEVYTVTHERQCNNLNRLSYHKMVAAIIFDKKVYVFDRSDRVVVFDLVERRWWSIIGLQSQMSEFHVVESDGKMVKIYSPKDGVNQYRFCSLEWDDEHRPSWVDLSESELKNKSWFLGHCGSGICIKDCQDNGVQAAVYQFTHEKDSPSAIKIQVHDLKAGTTHNVLPFPLFSLAACKWVDLGYSEESRV